MAAVALPEGYAPPVVIGGIGGSGTRVAATMLAELGFYLGYELNDALDNLAYTFLLKRPRWYDRRSTRQRRYSAAARPFLRSMTTGGKPPPREMLTLAGAMIGTIPRGHDRLGRRRGRQWASNMTRRIVAAGGHDPAAFAGWGWKEPNTIILLPELVTALPGMRFIHVIRDPEKLARRGHQTERMARNWSRHFSLQAPVPGEDNYARTLAFCREVTRRAQETGTARLGDRYHQLDVDALCADPEPAVDRLLAFLAVEVEHPTRARLLAIPDPGRLGAPVTPR
jgi:hypothetical protein